MSFIAYDSTRLAVGLVFFRSSAGKLFHPRTFIGGLREYGVVPYGVAPTLACAIITAESILSISHLGALGFPEAALGGCALLGAFALAVAINLIRGNKIPCYCTGYDDGEQVSLRSLARIVLVGIAEGALALGGRRASGGGGLPFSPATVGDMSERVVWAMLLILGSSFILTAPAIIRFVKRCITAEGLARPRR